MATDPPSHGPRRHFHRGRRGHDRRGSDRRGPQSPQAPQDAGARGDQVDVEQILREIRSRIAQRHGVDLTEQQVQDLAARRLESLLDPRTIKPSLLDQLRRTAGTPPDAVKTADRAEPPYTFEETTLYDSPNAFVRFMRKLLRPILRLFFNPDPLVRALGIQSRFNLEAGRREAERDARQAEWNALHFEILKRLVTEVAKVSLEIQSLALRVESLSAKVDFNERRVRGIEGTVQQARPGGGPRERERERDREVVASPVAAVAADAVPAAAAGAAEPAAAAVAGEGPRRRRRRRRGRRGGGREAVPGVVPQASAEAAVVDGEAELETDADLEGDEFDEPAEAEGVEPRVEARHPAPAAPPDPAPERVTPQLEAPVPDARETAAPELPAAPEPDADRHEPQ